MNTNKKLRVEHPIISSYPHHAMIMSIFSTKKAYLPVLYNYYFQLVYYKKERLDFSIGFDIVEYIKNYPIVEHNKISLNFLRKLGLSTKEFIINAIDDGFYIYLLADHFHIKKSAHYQSSHNWHDLMIYGYNKEKSLFYIGEFFNGKKYDYYEVSFEEILNSIEASLKDNDFHDWLEGIHFLRLKQDIFGEINYHIPVIKGQILDYLDSENTYFISSGDERRRNDDDYVYGISVYDSLTDMMIENIETYSDCDIRPFHVLFEHKCYIIQLIKDLKRIGKIRNPNYYFKAFTVIKRKMEIIRNLVIKYNVSKGKNILSNVVDKIIELKQEEFELLSNFHKDILNESINALQVFRDELHCNDIFVQYDKCVINTDRNNLIEYVLTKGNTMSTVFHGTSITLTGKMLDASFSVCLKIDGLIYSDYKLIIEDDSNEYRIDIANLEYGYHLLEVKSKCNRLSFIKCSVTRDDTKHHLETIARYNGIDFKTIGSWKGIYGKEGYCVIGGEEKLPYYLSEQNFTFLNSHFVMLSTNYKDDRAIKQYNNKGEKIAAYRLNAEEFEVDMIITGRFEKEVSFYLADYEKMGRKVTVQVVNADNNILLIENTNLDVTQGIYVKYIIRGHVRIKFKKVEGPDVTISGIFFS